MNDTTSTTTGFQMIPLAIEARGEIILNNLPAFREMMQAALLRINRVLATDEDFGQAELDVKTLKAVEEAVREAAIKSFDEKLKTLVDELTATAEELRAPRLELEKLIAKRKDDVRQEIVLEFLAEFDIEPADARRQFLVGLQTQLKGKRTLESMRTACRIYQVTQQALIHKSRTIIAEFARANGNDLVSDARDLELKSPESVEGELRRRIESQKAQVERKLLEAEAAASRAEAAKAQAALAESAKQPAPPVAPPTLTVAQAPPVAQLLHSDGGITAEEEWRIFRAACMTAFAPLKAAKKTLRHSRNAAKAQGFAAVVNQGFTDWVL
jgi:uncharacterized protein YunC (DUF1805 family)